MRMKKPNVATNSNSRVHRDIKPDDIKQYIKAAKNFHNDSNENSASAVANCYMVWRDTFGPSADQLLHNWMNEEIEKRNREIENHNKRVRNDTALDKNQKASRRFSVIKSRNGASLFTSIVKYIFDFVKPSDASMVSRYCTVLDWVHSKLGNQVVESADDVVTCIKDGGNLENIIRAQRGDRPAASSDRRSIISQAITASFKDAVRDADTKNVCKVDLRCNEGLVVLLGRYNGGAVEIVAGDNLKRPFRNQCGTSAARGWMAGPDVIPGRCSKPCRRPHVDADHPQAA